MIHSPLTSILVLLLASVALVWLFQRLRLSPVLGYLLAGILVGPHFLGLISQTEDIRILAEFGLVFLMFTVGLEFSLQQLLADKAMVLGLGAAQILVTGTLFGLLVWPLGMSPEAALIVGAAVAMSSTALVVKQLGEQGELDTQHGHAAVGILLFQDMAVIPFLIVIPILAGQAEQSPAWALIKALAQGVGVFLLLVLVGRWSLQALFDRIAATRSRELFMLVVLAVSLGAAWVSNVAGLSQAMGAFLAGLLIGETEFKRQVEADIRPFQDVLVGVFFIGVGMLLQLGALPQIWLHVLVGTILLIVIKAAVVAILARAMRLPWGSALRAGIVLGQGGEFGLVLISIALSVNLLPAASGQMVLTTIVLSMALAPLLIRFNQPLALRIYQAGAQPEPRPAPGAGAGMEGHAIICGYGRVGQGVARVLDLMGIAYQAIDTDARRVRVAQDAGERATYGDATRHRLLESAGLAGARALVITFQQLNDALKILEYVTVARPGMPVLIRAAGDTDLDRLTEAGAAEVVPEAMESSLTLASRLLLLLGVPEQEVSDIVDGVREDGYRPLRSFIPGQMPLGKEGSAHYQQYLHAVPVGGNAWVVGGTLKEIDLTRWGVMVSAIRRDGIKVAEPTPDTRLQEGDVLILSGTKQALRRAEGFLRKGHW